MPEANAAARRPSGELEASVLAALWAADGRALTPADVQRELGAALARTTVTTILARLHEKGSVSRTRSGRGYAYLPVQDSPGLAARRMRTELDKSAEDDRGTVLARFVSQLDPDDERVLRELLAEAGAAPPEVAGETGPGSGADGGSGSGAGAGSGSGAGPDGAGAAGGSTRSTPSSARSTPSGGSTRSTPSSARSTPSGGSTRSTPSAGAAGRSPRPARGEGTG